MIEGLVLEDNLHIISLPEHFKGDNGSLGVRAECKERRKKRDLPTVVVLITSHCFLCAEFGSSNESGSWSSASRVRCA